MTEAEWLTCTDPIEMLIVLDQLRPSPTERKCRLCSVEFCRRLKPRFLHDSARAAIEVAARYADGRATEAEREAAWQTVAAASNTCGAILHTIAMRQSVGDIDHVVENLDCGGSSLEPEEEAVAQANLYRDIFGNPFRPVTFSPAWRTDTAVSLARQMYESREFGAMPILADALQDAGCDNEDILAHCRDVTLVHVRGCWVVDYVLGKS